MPVITAMNLLNISLLMM